jgi:nicotinate-nucleotide pyrophosphorylase (carboxylating)
MIVDLTPNQINQLIKYALEEDLGAGDITTRNIVDVNAVSEAKIIAKEPLIVCGMDIFCAVFTYLDQESVISDDLLADGTRANSGDTLVGLRGKSRVLLEGERVALNILQKLSGIATLTNRYVEMAKPVRILDTRKTTPGLRIFEKYAVRCGGGVNHRFGLFDAVLIKDNHIRAAGGITQAIQTLRTNIAKEQPIEVETTTLDEVKEALAENTDIILLDNMDIQTIREAVAWIQGRAKIEVSGGITIDRLKELSTTGIDFISVGALTHSAPAVDISMLFSR